VPRPLTGVGTMFQDQHDGHIGRAGKCHAPQSAQRPSHFGDCAPHSWHTKTCLAFTSTIMALRQVDGSGRLDQVCRVGQVGRLVGLDRLVGLRTGPVR